MIDQQDRNVYDEVGSAYADVHLERDAEDVIRRGRTFRRRRRTMPALAAASALAFSLSIAAVTAQTHASSSATLVNVDEAAFSIHTDAQSGVVTLTIRELFDESQLKQLLAEAGIPAVFHAGPMKETDDGRKTIVDAGGCAWVGATLLNPGKVLLQTIASTPDVFTIDPSAMPRGSVLGFDFLSMPGKHGVVGVGATLLSTTPTGCGA
jgi:hypothetical protein